LSRRGACGTATAGRRWSGTTRGTATAGRRWSGTTRGTATAGRRWSGTTRGTATAGRRRSGTTRGTATARRGRRGATRWAATAGTSGSWTAALGAANRLGDFPSTISGLLASTLELARAAVEHFRRLATRSACRLPGAGASQPLRRATSAGAAGATQPVRGDGSHDADSSRHHRCRHKRQRDRTELLKHHPRAERGRRAAREPLDQRPG
jgi:hypothetical protein